MNTDLERPREVDLLERAELAVAGGGLAGVCAALSAAEAGLETVLVEERGALGWEISHGLELFLTPGSQARVPASFGKLIERLKAHHAFRGGVLDPVAAECLLDRLLEEAKVRVHFRAFAGRFDVQAGLLRLATKSGPLGIQARAVVDATETSRLARAAGAHFEALADPGQAAAHARAFLLCAVTPPASAETFGVEGVEGLERVAEVTLRPTLWENEAHVRFLFKVENPDRAESESRFLLARVIEALRKGRPGFEQANLSLSAHEFFALRVPKLDQTSLPEGLRVAGPAVLGRRPSLEERAALGEQAAVALAETLRGVAAE